MSQPEPGLLIDAAQSDFDKRHAPFDQTPGHQAALSETVATVGVANGIRFFVKRNRGGRGDFASPESAPARSYAAR